MTSDPTPLDPLGLDAAEHLVELREHEEAQAYARFVEAREDLAAARRRVHALRQATGREHVVTEAEPAGVRLSVVRDTDPEVEP